MPAVPQSRNRWAAVLAAAALLLAPAPAGAAARLCRQLQAALAQTSGNDGGGMRRAYDRAIAAQIDAIARTRTRIAVSACSPSFFGQGRCDRLQASLREMQDNLVSLRRTRAGFGESSNRAERNRLLASLEANGCRADNLPEASTPKSQAADAATSGQLREFARPPRRLSGQPFCVRTCDGYFFPMTRTTAPVADQAVCEAACPGTPMEVFYRSSDAEPESMISGRTNLAYAELETANLFRDVGRPQPRGCGCNAVKGYQVMSKPVAPETLLNPDVPDAAAKSQPDPAGSTEMKPLLPAGPPGPPAERKVRVVGPTFLPAPEAAEAQQAPAPTPVP